VAVAGRIIVALHLTFIASALTTSQIHFAHMTLWLHKCIYIYCLFLTTCAVHRRKKRLDDLCTNGSIKYVAGTYTYLFHGNGDTDEAVQLGPIIINQDLAGLRVLHDGCLQLNSAIGSLCSAVFLQGRGLRLLTVHHRLLVHATVVSGYCKNTEQDICIF
jgi:hypothetical protein